MPAGGVRVACCQISPDVVRPEESRARAVEAIAAAVSAGAQIVVLPELVTCGYVFESVEEARAGAFPADDEWFAGWAREAARGDAVVIGGFCEQGPDGRLFNSSALVDGDGLRAVYRKLHLWGEEPRWFSAGDRLAPILDTRHGRIGLAVCYDIEFPELTRGLALGGAELIALPANWPRDPTPILHSLALTTAYLNRLYVAVCDRCGSERGLEFEGGSVIAAPDGSLCAGPVADRGVETLIADCDLDEARRKRNGPHNDAFADRRPAYLRAGADRRVRARLRGASRWVSAPPGRPGLRVSHQHPFLTEEARVPIAQGPRQAPGVRRSHLDERLLEWPIEAARARGRPARASAARRRDRAWSSDSRQPSTCTPRRRRMRRGRCEARPSRAGRSDRSRTRAAGWPGAHRRQDPKAPCIRSSRAVAPGAPSSSARSSGHVSCPRGRGPRARRTRPRERAS